MLFEIRSSGMAVGNGGIPGEPLPKKSIPTGLPTIRLLPSTTTRLPSVSILFYGLARGFRPAYRNKSILILLTEFAQVGCVETIDVFAGDMVEDGSVVDMIGRGACTRMP